MVNRWEFVIFYDIFREGRSELIGLPFLFFYMV
jgi:hypothetical protein